MAVHRPALQGPNCIIELPRPIPTARHRHTGKASPVINIRKGL